MFDIILYHLEVYTRIKSYNTYIGDIIYEELLNNTESLTRKTRPVEMREEDGEKREKRESKSETRSLVTSLLLGWNFYYILH